MTLEEFKEKLENSIVKIESDRDFKTLIDIYEDVGLESGLLRQCHLNVSRYYAADFKFIVKQKDKFHLNNYPKDITEDDITNLQSIFNYYFTNFKTKQTIMKNFNEISKPATKMSKKSMFNNIIEKYKSQYFPTKVDDLRIATDGSICVPQGDEYIAIDANNNLKAYPAELCMSVPVFTVKKPFNEIKANDIIKHNNQYAKVISTETKNNSIKTLTYKGVTSTKKEIVDVILGQSFVEVVVNMFSGFGANTGGINPMFLMMAQEDGDFSMKDMMMLQMMQGQGQSFNPMMFMLMDKDGDDNSMMNMMIMSQMMGGQGFNFGNLFGGQKSAPATPVQE